MFYFSMCCWNSELNSTCSPVNWSPCLCPISANVVGTGSIAYISSGFNLQIWFQCYSSRPQLRILIGRKSLQDVIYQTLWRGNVYKSAPLLVFKAGNILWQTLWRYMAYAANLGYFIMHAGCNSLKLNIVMKQQWKYFENNSAKKESWRMPSKSIVGYTTYFIVSSSNLKF